MNSGGSIPAESNRLEMCLTMKSIMWTVFAPEEQPRSTAVNGGGVAEEFR